MVGRILSNKIPVVLLQSENKKKGKEVFRKQAFQTPIVLLQSENL